MQRSVRRGRRTEGPARQSRPRRHQDFGGPAAAPRRRSARRGVRRSGGGDRGVQGGRAGARLRRRRALSRVRARTACRSCISSRRRSARCRARVTRSRWSPTDACPALPARCRRRFTSRPNASPAARSARVQDGDIVRLDSYAGTLEVARAGRDAAQPRRRRGRISTRNEHGVGRELFATFRDAASDAETGAVSLFGIG